MKQSSKLKSILSLLLSILLVIGISTGCTAYHVSDDPTSTTEYSTQSTTSDDSIGSSDSESKSEEVTISSETQELVSDTLDAIENNGDIATDEVIESSESEEATVVDEGALEADAQVEQENVSYDGVSKAEREWVKENLLGPYQGITYYSQADSRWANLLYTSTGNKSQTMKSSACGPTAAAMIVSSSKGAILPTTMAQLFVDNGYRTANNGTAWACWPFVADYFDFDEYYTTTSDSKMLSYLKTDKNNDGISDYFVVASCNNGLWTTGGHYIVLIGYDDGHIIVFDPYLYNGKFHTPSRRAAGVVVSGNSAFVSESSFKTYSNTKQYWIYSNDSADAIKSGTSSSTSTSTTTQVNYTRYVATQSANLNVRSGPGTNYRIVGSLKKGTKVTVSATSGSWSQIGTNKWVSTSYLSASQVSSTSSSTSTSTSTTYSTSVGKTYKLKSATTLYSRSNLSGTKYQYKAKTTVKVLSHASSKVDYVYVVQTGRYAYCPVSAFGSTSTTSAKKSTVGQYRRLKSKTTLYSNSNLTGTQYQYLAGTQVKILKNVSATVDYIQVTKTGRKAHVRVSAYK